MNINEYQQQASKTAIYQNKLIYPTLGLAGEAGEIANKVKKILRDNSGNLQESVREDLICELGDVLWYIAALATDLNVELSDVANKNIEKLNSRKNRGTIGGSGDNR
jgi:NTP pyrophosphatase (non-canonical NTP hydrolase)